MMSDLASTRHTNSRDRTKLAAVAAVVLIALLALNTLATSGYGDGLRVLFREIPVTTVERAPEGTVGAYALIGSGPSHVTDAETAALAQPWQPPTVDYPGAAEATNPVTSAQQGLTYWNRYLATGDTRFADRMLAVADWLFDEQAVDGAWRYSFAFHDLEPGWVSAMAQGQGISVLVRAGAYRGESRYLDAARRAYAFMELAAAQGGTLGVLDGAPFYEEYPGSTWAPHVLNGSIFALIGVHELAEWTDDPVARERFNELAASLGSALDRYDTGWWSSYALAPGHEIASPEYHHLHVRQLEVMAVYTADERWSATGARWRGYAEDNRLRLLLHKVVGLTR